MFGVDIHLKHFLMNLPQILVNIKTMQVWSVFES